MREKVIKTRNDAPAVKQGAAIGGWSCFVLATALMYFSLWTLWLYLPLLLAAFVLSIVAMSQRRILGGLLLMFAILILSPIEWFALAANRGDKFLQDHLPPEQRAAYDQGKAPGKELVARGPETSQDRVAQSETTATATAKVSEADAFERRVAGAVAWRDGAPSIIQLTGDTIPIVYEIKAPQAAPREGIAQYILGFTYRDMDAFSKRDFVNKLSQLISRWVHRAKAGDLYAVTVPDYQFGEYDFERSAFPTHIHAYWDPNMERSADSYGDAYGERLGDVELVDDNGNRTLDQNGRTSESNTEYLICFANRRNVEFAPMAPEKARLLAQAIKNARNARQAVKMTFTGTLAKCTEKIDKARSGGSPYDSATRRIYVNISDMKLTIPPTGESIVWHVPNTDQAVQGEDEKHDRTSADTGGASRTPAEVPTVAGTPATTPPNDANKPPDVSRSPVQPAVADLPSPSTSPTPSPPTQTNQNSCIVVGLAAGDYLNVRAAPAMNSAAVFKLANGDVVQVRGESVYNGDTEWVPVASGPQSGWVRNKYLRPYTK